MNHKPHNTHKPRRSHHRRTRGGFTMIEVSLALVLSGLVLAGAMSVFIAMRNAERTFDARYQRTSELDITRTSFSRAMLSLQMQESEGNIVVREGSEQQAEQQEEGEVSRPRIILEYDTTVEPDSTGWVPQRLEVVCATPPVPPGLASRAAGWYTAQAREESLDFSAMDGSQGITRGVFELRRTGERERVMQRLGLIGANDPILSEQQLQQQPDPTDPPDWTLWWRPILTTEGEQLNAGYGPLPDTVGNPEEIRARLAGAIPLLRHVERCIWELYKGDEFIDTHTGIEMQDLPAYAQFEVILTNQQYASWMFEIDWVVGEDPLSVASGGAANADGTDADADDQNTGNPGGNPGDGDGRPGNRGLPSGTNRFDLNENS